MNSEPPITQIYLVRHAPVTDATDGIYTHVDVEADLSDTAAIKAARRALPKDARWWVSPRIRACQTAAVLTDAEAQVSDGFREQDFGDWHGLDFPALWTRIEKLPAHNWSLLAADTQPPGGDSYVALFDRAGNALDQLIEDYPGENHVIVTHAGVIRALVGHALGISPDQSLALCAEPLSVSHLVHRPGAGLGGDWQVQYLNRR